VPLNNFSTGWDDGSGLPQLGQVFAFWLTWWPQSWHLRSLPMWNVQCLF